MNYCHLVSCNSPDIQNGQNIKVLYTAALIDDFYEERKAEYLRSLQALQSINRIPYIVESIKSASFFDECEVPVFYSKTNNPRFCNKGINEAISMLAAINFYNFDENDIIVKLTGRYFFINESLFSVIELETQKDAYVKHTGIHSQPIYEIDYFTGCFAMRCKYLKMFLNELDLQDMESKATPIEWELGKFLKRHPEVRVHHVDMLHVIAHGFASSYNVGPPKLY